MKTVAVIVALAFMLGFVAPAFAQFACSWWIISSMGQLLSGPYCSVMACYAAKDFFERQGYHDLRCEERW